MEYDRLSPMESDSARETTMVTRASVQEMLASAGAFQGLTDRAKQPPTELIRKMETPKAPDAVQTAIQAPPHMRGPVSVTVKAKPRAPLPEGFPELPEAPVEEPMKPFLKRLFGG